MSLVWAWGREQGAAGEEGRAGRGARPPFWSDHQPSTVTDTVLVLVALGAVIVSRPSR